MDLRNVKVAVVGLARSGLASVELLAEKGANVTACDTRPVEQLPEAGAVLDRLGVPFRLQSPEALEGAEWVVISPGVPADLDLLATARQSGSRVVGEVELAGWFLQGGIIGITGSNGKTTTTALTGHILSSCGIPSQVGGNIGTVPATALVRTSSPGCWNVLELSSFQLETINRFRARIAVLLNVTQDHLDRHHTFASYAGAKARLLETQQPEDFAVLNADDPVCVELASRTAGQVLWFSLARKVDPGVFLERDRLVLGGSVLMPADEIPLRGRHNIENVMAAALAAYLAGASRPDIAAAVRTFRAVEHRLEFVRRVRGVDYYNDSKATNVDSALKAVEAFDTPLWVILGGKDKGSDYTPLARPLAEKARAALLIGAAAPKIAAVLEGAVPVTDCRTIGRAVQAAFRQARAGDTVVLAPACASFDQFDNYEHRGRVFKELVGRLEEG
ncbi:MAG: UDP-N-acetylmuramoyl-L-alanine--D-glutamate ligase [Bryobacterales bacterium]|nr:UDP-N-acetylmuramoyl-L-alanine--D-glutamate ligase [Bryobacterales bacterium]